MAKVCLGIESTAHTFSASIVNSEGKILSNVSKTYSPPTGFGIKPIDAAQHHDRVKEDILEKSLQDAGLEIGNIDFLVFSLGPGLPPCLHTGFDFISEISRKINKPVYGINHAVAHIEIAKSLTKCKDPTITYLSGGNSQIIGYNDKRYRVLGETMDISIGNALDKLALSLGLEWPGGPKIEHRAKAGKWLDLPYTVKGMDFSFAGIVTAAQRAFKNNTSLEDICFSVQETAFSEITEVTERGMAALGKSELLLTGGVAANKRLHEMLETMCKERGAKLFVVPKEFAGDNGAQIAWTGVLAWKSGQRPLDLESTRPNPRWRVDEMEISWMVD